MFQIFLNVVENYVLMYTLYSFNLSNHEKKGSKSKIYYYWYSRAKQNRREMIKQQIETMLNIKGKDMPSVEEEFGSGGMLLLQPFK